jgi:adenylate cyclase
VSYGYVSPEGHESKASKGFVYPLGGFFVRGGNPMATGDVKRKLTAIFSADVEGYSRLMEEDELATIETLTSHKEIMRKLIRQYRGRVVDSTGDNLLAEFASVVDAVQCAVEVQQVLSAKNETLPENRRMYFRIGINLGDVVEEGKRIYGDGVNVAARVESLAEGGGISISGTAYDQLGKKLPLGYEYLGEQTVKNIEKPVRVYRILTEAEAAGKVIGEIRPKTTQLRGVAIGAVAVLIIVAGALAIWNFYLRPDVEPASLERMAFALPDKPSIAVLPFKNLSGDQEQEYLADGISENIITTLSKTPKMFVIASNSVFTYKGKPIKVQQVAEEMGVRYVLEGSLQKSGDRLRINAQLIDAIEGHHLWAERYDRQMKDLFAIQDEITMKILTAMEVKLTEGEAAKAHAKGTVNLEAYLKDLQGREHLRKLTKEDNMIARKLLEEAIALDPNFPSPYVGLAYTYMIAVPRGWTDSPRRSLAKAEELAQKAIALDDSLDMAHALVGRLNSYKRQYEKAISEGKKAVALGPNNSGNMAMLAINLRVAGKAEEAVKWAEKAVRINPKPPLLYMALLGYAYGDAGRYEDAITTYKKVLKQNPNYDLVPVRLSAVYMLAGHKDEARAAVEELLKKNPKLCIESVKASLKRRMYKSENIYAHVIEGLRKAGLPETPPLPLPDKPSIAVLPFVNMSGDPEQEYFSDGITEEIITALSKTPKLFVIARTSSFKYKGKEVDVRTVGRELGVRYVLEGSVRKSEDQLRITAQLVDAKTGNHVWAERYDRDLKDIFAIQDEITKKILTELQVKLTSGEQARLRAKGTDNLPAYLRMLHSHEQRG